MINSIKKRDTSGVIEKFNKELKAIDLFYN